MAVDELVREGHRFHDRLGLVSSIFFVEKARKLLFLGSGSIVFFLMIKFREIFLLGEKGVGPASFSGLQSE